MTPTQYKAELIRQISPFVNENKLQSGWKNNSYFARKQNLVAYIHFSTTIIVGIEAYNCSGANGSVTLHKKTFKYSDRPNIKDVVQTFKKYKRQIDNFYK